MIEDIFRELAKFMWFKLDFKMKSNKRKQKTIKRKVKKRSDLGEPSQPNRTAFYTILEWPGPGRDGTVLIRSLLYYFT